MKNNKGKKYNKNAIELDFKQKTSVNDILFKNKNEKLDLIFKNIEKLTNTIKKNISNQDGLDDIVRIMFKR